MVFMASTDEVFWIPAGWLHKGLCHFLDLTLLSGLIGFDVSSTEDGLQKT